MSPELFIDPNLTIPDRILLKNLLRDIQTASGRAEEKPEHRIKSAGKPSVNGHENGQIDCPVNDLKDLPSPTGRHISAVDNASASYTS